MRDIPFASDQYYILTNNQLESDQSNYNLCDNLISSGQTIETMRDGQTGLDKIKLDQTRISPYILIIDHNLNLL